MLIPKPAYTQNGKELAHIRLVCPATINAPLAKVLKENEIPFKLATPGSLHEAFPQAIAEANR